MGRQSLRKFKLEVPQHSSAGGSHSLADCHLYRQGSDRDMSLVVKGLLLHMVWTGALLGVNEWPRRSGRKGGTMCYDSSSSVLTVT